MSEITYVNVLAKQAEVREMTEAYVKQQMLSYDSIEFDSAIPKVNVNGLPNSLMRIEWNDDDVLMLTLCCKIKGVYTLPISSLRNETLYGLADTMNMLTVSTEVGE